MPRSIQAAIDLIATEGIAGLRIETLARKLRVTKGSFYWHFRDRRALQRALLQYYEPRNAEKVVKALKMTHREDLIPLLVPAAGRRAVQRSARRAEAADVTIHNDGTYTVRPNQKGHNGKPAHGQSRAAAPTGRAPSPGARFAPHSAPARKPKNDQQKENTTWKTGKKKK